MKSIKRFACLTWLCILAVPFAWGAAKDLNENPLPTCPPDWKVEVVAEMPNIHHPSAVCVTPDGRVLVAQDPMDQSPEGIKAIDSILCYHPSGKVTVWATNLYAVFGLAYYDGKVYVHQYPKLTMFTDEGDTGSNPQDMFNTHPKPIGGLNDHIPANLRLGMDGYFYMDTGDKGIYGAVGKDGSKVDLIGGGIMRFRPDGTQLEIYASGTRNHLDIAINWEDEMFTYDNTDDGNGWWTRVTHMVDRGFYGYPYDYKPRRAYTLWMMQDYGGGSPTGAICYNEDALPDEYQGNLFMSEWGKGELARFVVARDGGSYRIVKREAFLKKRGKEFRPLGIDVTPDGMGFYVADWNYGGWMAKGQDAGRFLKITYTGKSQAVPKPKWFEPAAMGKAFNASINELAEGLKHPSQRVRLVAQRRLAEKGSKAVPEVAKILANQKLSAEARSSALWTLDAVDGGASSRSAILKTAADPEIRVRSQVIRQLGTRKVNAAVQPLILALSDNKPMVRFRAATALGRIADPAAVPALLKVLNEKDLFVRYSIFTALNFVGRKNPAAWAQIAASLDNHETEVRDAALFAMRETYDVANAQALASVVQDSSRCGECRAAALPVLAELHRKRPEWKGSWWGTQPVKSLPPAKIVDWEGTPLVLGTVRNALNDSSLEVRLAAIEAVEITRDPETGSTLAAAFKKEKEADIQRLILKALAASRAPEATSLLLSILKNGSQYSVILPEAVSAAEKIGGPEMAQALSALLSQWTGAALQKEIMAALGTLKARESIPQLASFAKSADTNLSAGAVAAIAKIGGDAALKSLLPLLEDPDQAVRRAGIFGLRALRNKAAVPALLKLYEQPETRVDALLALAAIPDLRALDTYLGALAEKNASVRDASRKAIEAIRREALPVIETKIRDGSSFPAPVLSALQRIYKQEEKALSGPIFQNHSDASSADAAVYADFAGKNAGNAAHGRSIFEDLKGVACIKCHKVAGKGGEVGPDLTSVGGKYNRTQIIESILYPSKLILDGYQQTTVFTRDGDLQTGILRGETAEELTLVDSEGLKHTIPKREIEKRKVSELSLMPEGMHVGISKQDFSDLVTYVEGLKDKPEAAK
ncbi:MAG: putative rane-bound dehydrogenase [Verrucomicrobiales bacterium]|nr:putative rane-bound dehydrogenase [Verrucomicrobiales bacterium]